MNAGIGWQQPCIQTSQTEVRVEVWVHCDGNVASGVFWGASYGAASVWILPVCLEQLIPSSQQTPQLQLEHMLRRTCLSAACLLIFDFTFTLGFNSDTNMSLQTNFFLVVLPPNLCISRRFLVPTCRLSDKPSHKKKNRRQNSTFCARINILAALSSVKVYAVHCTWVTLPRNTWVFPPPLQRLISSYKAS